MNHTEHTAKTQSLRTGLSATLRAFLPSARGSGAPSARPAFAFGISASLIAMVAVLLTSAAPATASESCPNEARREEQGAAGRALPDCRAYELVSPPSTTPRPEHPNYFAGEPPGNESNLEEPYDFGSINMAPALYGNLTSSDGNAFLFGSPEGWGTSAAYCGCLSRRTPSGWVGEDLLPSLSPMSVFCLGSAEIVGITPDLEHTVLRNGTGVERCGHAEPPLVEGEPEPENPMNIFLRTAAGSYQLVNVTPPGATPFAHARFGAVSADASHVLFESEAALTPDTPAGGVTNIYVWDHAQPDSVRLLTVRPGGTAVHGPGLGGAYLAGTENDTTITQGGVTSAAGLEEAPEIAAGNQGFYASAQMTNAISANGERVLFYAGGRGLERRGESYYPGGGLYLREHPGADQSALAHGGAIGAGTLTAGSATVSALLAATATAKLSAGSDELVEVTPKAGRFLVGQTLVGEGIPPGTTIAAVAGGSLTLSAAVEAGKSGNAVPITATGPQPPFAVGQTLVGKGIPPGTAIVACSPDCSTPTELTLSAAATANEAAAALEGFSECTEPEKACTVQIDLAQPAAPGSSGSGQFQWASADTSRIFFTDEERLTSDSTAAPGQPDLYEYDTEKPQEQRLTDLTAGAPEPADVLGVSGASEDGSYLYFTAQGDLTGSQPNSHGDTALGPAEGTGTMVGPAEGTGTLTTGSPLVTGVSGGPFAIGEVIKGEGIPPGTTIAACSPDCSTPTELTLSASATEDKANDFLEGQGSSEITGLNTTSGAFHVGMAISGTGIPAHAWIKEVAATTLTLSERATSSGPEALSATAANLYLRHAGATTFIAALDPTSPERCDWFQACLTARVSTNGAFIAFNSVNSLTGYNNAPVRANACTAGGHQSNNGMVPTRWPCMEVFRYAAASGPHGELTCASCHPDGSAPAAEYGYAKIEMAAREAGSYSWLPHNVSDSGQVFFYTMEKLLPTDENEAFDVYEYEGGEGPGAQLHLISSGKSEEPSYFFDATPSGSDAFFVTTQALVRSDIRVDFDLYDARAGGGFPEPLIPPCEGESCRGEAQTPPTLNTPSHFIGPEEGKNHPRCQKDFVLRHHKCVKKHRKSRRHHHRRAGK